MTVGGRRNDGEGAREWRRSAGMLRGGYDKLGRGGKLALEWVWHSAQGRAAVKLISSLLRGARLRAAGLPAPPALAALLALLALAGAALLAIAPAQADTHPDDLELVLSLVDDSDNIVPPGGEFTVGAELRFTSPPPAERRLRVAANSVLRLSGNLDWEDQALHKLNIAQTQATGGAPALAATTAGGGLPSNSEMTVRALDGRTLVARSSLGGPDNLYIFDAWNKRQVAVIEPPPGAHAETFGQGQNQRWYNPKSIAVWQETDETAWLFVGAGWDRVETTNTVGQVWIFRLDWSADPLEVTVAGKVAPPSSEFNNKQSGGVAAYGTGVVISRDGSTLAVSANEINNIGAVYVYSRPDGAGEDWGDLKHADGVKVTPVATPAWGTSTTRPFDPASTGRTGAATDCDAYCSRVSAQTGGGTGRSDFLWAIDLSADGSVLAVGAKSKRYPSDTPGGSFTGGTASAGEAYIFLAPNGDWRTTPEVTGTLIPALTDARQFDPEQHYSPGPARRVTEPAAVLLPQPWASAVADQQFGHEVYMSHDGTTVAVAETGTAANRDKVYVFQRASAAAWAGAGDVLPSADLESGSGAAVIRGGLAISGDGSQVLVGDETHNGDRGRILVYSRPADGQWTGSVPAGDARILQAPTPRGSGRFGWPRYDLDGERLATTETAEWIAGSGFFWLSDGGCTQRVVDGQPSWSCSINLGTAKVVIPPGTEASTATISGDVRIEVEGIADSAVLLEDELVVRIGEVKEVDSLSFDFATNTKGTTTTSDDEPHPSTLNARGDKTTLQLGILNENGKAAATGSVSSVLFTTSVGRLSTTFGEGASRGCVGGPSPSCSLNLATLDTTNAGAIPITLEHMGTVGTATVRATVVAEADGRLLEAEAIEVVLAGPPAALAIAAPASGVLNVNAESTAGAEASGTDSDARDQLTLVVTAADKAGNKVELPTGLGLAWVSDADGRRVTNGVEVVWPLGGAETPRLDVAGNQRVRVDVNRDATAPLPNGEYTLEVRVGALRATQTFNVSGGPETVALGEPEGALRVGERFTVTATINDAGGAPVPDGTRVSWQAIPLGSFSSITQVTADSRTTAGRASATYLVVSPGRTTVSAAADGKQDIRVVAVADTAPPPTPPEPGELLSSQAPGPAIWLGEYEIEASGLLSALPHIGSVQMWQYGKWLRYAVAEGRVVPGSRQFTIEPNAVLWLGR